MLSDAALSPSTSTLSPSRCTRPPCLVVHMAAPPPPPTVVMKSPAARSAPAAPSPESPVVWLAKMTLRSASTSRAAILRSTPPKASLPAA